ncbi:MAG TPA: alpha/beta hydrolase [Vicinamibacterales bacterium]|nr:alpha/beta hydrolase [Vicinamibacterales bacterium]
MRRLIRILKYVGAAAIGLILILVPLSLSYRAYRQHRIAEGREIRSSDGIDSLESVRIGGIDQWIHVRGQHVNNPILLFIHGGPGIAFIPMAGTFQGPWERHFTVVQWDQRGAGKTYARNDRELQRRTMSVPRMEQDALEVVNYLRQRFKRDKIVVLGHSWGSVLGLWLAHEHPGIIDAYVGVAQLVNATLNEKTAYEDALEMARTRHRVEAIRDLEGIQPYPPPGVDLRKGSIAQTWQAELLGPPADRSFLNMRRILSTLLTAPEYSLADVYGFTRAQLFSLDVMIPQMQKIDVATLGTDFRVPIFFFQGRLDPYTRPALIAKYADTITAPRRELVWFEEAGHFPFFEDQERFTDELLRRVLPLAGHRP